MTSEAATVKLMWVLGHTKDLNEIEEMMTTNYVGEISFSGAVGLGGS
jgi:glutamyl-tRNA(Gln) amidotransferase subunit D